MPYERPIKPEYVVIAQSIPATSSNNVVNIREKLGKDAQYVEFTVADEMSVGLNKGDKLVCASSRVYERKFADLGFTIGKLVVDNATGGALTITVFAA